MIPSDLIRNEQVYFIPYTTDPPLIRVGQIEQDNKDKFIKYRNGLCDNGEWYICRTRDIKDTQIIHRLNTILSEVKNAR